MHTRDTNIVQIHIYIRALILIHICTYINSKDEEEKKAREDFHKLAKNLEFADTKLKMGIINVCVCVVFI